MNLIKNDIYYFFLFLLFKKCLKAYQVFKTNYIIKRTL